MTQRFLQLTEQIQFLKKEIATYRQKCKLQQSISKITLEQLDGNEQQKKQFKKTIEKLQQTNNRLSNSNNALMQEKQSIISDYSTQLEEVKQQIIRKQRQVADIRDNTITPAMSHQLLKKQIRLEVQNQFQEHIDVKAKKIEQITAQLDRAHYEKEIQKEKSHLKIMQLETSLQSLESRHLIELQQYSNKLYAQTQFKPSTDEKQVSRRLRRDNQQLRKRIQTLNQQLTETINQKCKINKDFSLKFEQNAKSVQDNHQQLRMFKIQHQKLDQLLKKERLERDHNPKDFEKDKQIRKLRTEVQMLNQELLNKEKRISQHEVQIVNLSNEVKKIKNYAQCQESQIVEKVFIQKEKIKRELMEAKSSLEKMRIHNTQLTDNMFDISKKIINQKKFVKQINQRNVTVEEEENVNQEHIRKKLVRNTSEGQLKIPTNDGSQNLQNQKHYYQGKLLKQQIKVKQFVEKYVQMKKKYKKAQHKLELANQKIVDLLQTKIKLGSPTATTKKAFKFPGDEFDPEYSFSRHGSPPPPQAFHSQSNFKGSQENKKPQFSRTNPHRNDFLSPQVNPRIETNSKSNQKSFYEKSIKIKHQHRLKQLKCTNHNQDHSCEHHCK